MSGNRWADVGSSRHSRTLRSTTIAPGNAPSRSRCSTGRVSMTSAPAVISAVSASGGTRFRRVRARASRSSMALTGTLWVRSRADTTCSKTAEHAVGVHARVEVLPVHVGDRKSFYFPRCSHSRLAWKPSGDGPSGGVAHLLPGPAVGEVGSDEHGRLGVGRRSRMDAESSQRPDACASGDPMGAGSTGRPERKRTLLTDSAAAESLLAAFVSRAGRDNPYPVYRELLALPGLPRLGDGSLMMTRFADCSAGLRNPDVGHSDDVGGARVPDWRNHPSLLLFGTSLLGLDPPVHTRLRRIVSGSFTHRRVAGLRPAVTAVVHELLEN